MSNISTRTDYAVSAKKPRFLNFFENSILINTTLGFSFVAVCGVCVALIALVSQQVLTPKPIYYVPGALNAGYAKPNEIPKGSIIGFATSWALNRMNFSPETIQEVHEHAKKFMAPELLSQSIGIFDDELRSVTKSSISSFFSLNNDPILKDTDDTLSVVLKGSHGLYMGKTNIKTSQLKITVFMQRVAPTELNPYGLMVSNIEKSEEVSYD